MKKTIYILLLLLLVSASKQSFACSISGTPSAGSLNPTVLWQTTSANTYTYYSFTATAGQVFEFSFCAVNGGSNSVDTQIEIFNSSDVSVAYNDDHCGLGSYIIFTAPVAGTYRIAIYRYNCQTTSVAAGTLAYRTVTVPTWRDCAGARPICSTSYNQGPITTNNIPNNYPNEIPSTGGCPGNCLTSGERNCMWYTFNSTATTTTTFMINSSDDYDWAIYDVTGRACADIYNNISTMQVSCNYSLTTGNTGATIGYSSHCNGAAADQQFNAPLNLQAGHSYVLAVSHFTSSGSAGHTLTFSNNIIDNTSPNLASIVSTPSCGSNSLTIRFSERVMCTGVQPTDFTLTGPNGNYAISNIWSSLCNAAATSTWTAGTWYDDIWTINLTDALIHSGTYTLTLLSGGVQDVCMNNSAGNSLTFNIVGISADVTSTNVACNGASTGSINVSNIAGGTPPYSIAWTGPAGFTRPNDTGLTSSSVVSLSNLPVGAYTYTISGSVGPCVEVGTVNISSPPALTYSTNITQPTCAGGGNNGSVTITPSGGVSPYDIQLGTSTQNDVASYNFTNLSGGNYGLTVTDVYGCQTTGTISLTNTTPGNPSFNYNGNQCFNGHSFNFTHTGAVIPGETYRWTFTGANTTSSTSENPTGITWGAAGTYNVTLEITTPNCVVSSSQNITIYQTPAPTLSVTNAACGANNGSISVNQTYNNYSWSGTTQTTQTISNLGTGTYTVTVTDANSCTGSASATVSGGGTMPTITNIATTAPTCAGSCDGTATVTATGCTNYTYNFSAGTTPSNSSTGGLCSNTYTVTVSNSANTSCSTSQSFTIPTTTGMTLTMSSTNSTCGNTNGSASVSVTGGTPAYTYTWSPTAGSSTTLNNVASNTYTVTVKDANNCTASNNVTVNDTGIPFTINASVNNNITCHGQNNGSATVTPNPAGAYTYLWSNGQTTATATGLGVGSHTVQVTSAGCSANASVTISEPTAISANISNIVNAHCGQADGSIGVTASGGTGVLTYTWNTTPNQTTATASNIISGTYIVTVKDGNSCTATAQGTITDIAGITVGLTNTPISCFGGSNGTATATVTGGSPNYTYNWSTGTNNTSASTTNTINGLVAGAVSVTVSDNFGCTATASTTLLQNTAINISIASTQAASCHGSCDARVQLLVTGGAPSYTYSWSSGANPSNSNINTSLCAGSHQVTVKDVNNCTANFSYTITEPTTLVLNTSSTNENCGLSDGTATVTATGGSTPYSYTWSAGNSLNTQTNTGLSAASSPYLVTVRDNSGCEATASVTINNISTLNAIISIRQDVRCNGNSNGTATVSVSGGTPNYTYTWNTTPVQNNASAINLPAGTYRVTARDAIGCQATAEATINQPDLISVSIVSPPIPCHGACNGQATAQVLGGTAPYDFIWSNIQTSQNINNLCAGSYSVTVRDNNSCTTSGSVTINSGTPILVTESITPSHCGRSDGAINITVSGGSGTYTYLWSNGAISEDIFNIAAGPYTVTITDHKGCTKIVAYSISDLSAHTSQITSHTNPKCNGSCDGIATVTTTGGSGSFQYTWNTTPVQTTSTATHLCAGPINVEVLDLTTGCIAIATYNLDNPPALDVIAGITDISCSNTCDGAIDITVIGGTAPYTYSWVGNSLNATTQDISNLCTGNYSLALLDHNNCYLTRNYTITQPSFITLSMASTPVKCYGNNNGTATVTATGGTGLYTYLWNNGQTTATAMNLSAGTYSVTVRDAHGCSSTNTVTVTSPPKLSIINTAVDNALCHSSLSGSINITVNGGTMPISYTWSNGQTTSHPISLSSGIHCVTITDNNLCSIDTCINIAQPQAINIILNATNEQCHNACDGSIVSNVTGGTGNYSYLWSNTSVTANINNLCSGIYNITVKDANNCEAYSSTSITGPSILGIAIQNITQPTCGNSNGNIRIGTTGGTSPFTYTWQPNLSNSNILSNVPSGNYSITVKDAHNCTYSETFSLSDQNGPQITSVTPTNITCYGETNGQASITYTSPTINNTITWSNGQNGITAINLAAGSYRVSVTDNNGCIAFEDVTITEPPQLFASIANYNNASCSGLCNGSATAIATGGSPLYTYSWSNGDNTITANNLCAGSYDVTVRDMYNCSVVANVNIIQPTPLSVTGVVTNVRCNGGNDGIISISASGGSGNYYYSWPQISQTSAIVQGLRAANYTVYVYDIADPNCFISSNFDVSEPPPIIADLVSINAYCGLNNGVAYIDHVYGGQGSFSFIWHPGNMTSDRIDNLTPGQYTVSITDGNGCTASNTITVAETMNLQIDNVVYNGVTCYGYNDGFAQIYVSGGSTPYTYHWTPNVTTEGISSTLYAGLYSVTVQDKDGCRVPTQFPISSPEEIIVYPNDSTIICIGQQVVVSANASGGTPAYTYNWSGLGNGSTFIVSPTSSVEYIVTAYDSHNCSSSPVSQKITVHPPLSLALTIGNPTICKGSVGIITANATGGDGNYTYNWGNSNVSTSNTFLISPDTTTVYTVILKDGCTTPADTSMLTVAVSPNPDIHIIRSPFVGCSPLTVTFDNNTSNMTYSYYWNFDDINSGTDNHSDLKRPSHTFNEIGKYEILAIVSTPSGCKDSAKILVNVHKGPVADFNAFPWTTSLFEPKIEFYDNSQGATVWEWNFNDGTISSEQNPNHTFVGYGKFPVILKVYSENGCVDTVSKSITITEDHKIYFPDAINLRSPGNNEFYPLGIGIDEQYFQMSIYNRWGELIFTTNDINVHWKGKYNMNKGEFVPQGMYVYVVKLRDKFGKDHNYAGTVTVFK